MCVCVCVWGGGGGGRMINGQKTTCDFSCPEAKQCVSLEVAYSYLVAVR